MATYGTSLGAGPSGFGSCEESESASAISGIGMPAGVGMQRKTCIAHVAFKLLALVLYIFSGLFFSSEYVLTFVAVVLFSAFDLWTVKNITGRLLVGLRWWNEIDAAGASHWRFESYEGQRVIHPADSNVFWIALFATPAAWLLLATASFFTLKFHWLLLTLVALFMTGINVAATMERRANRHASRLPLHPAPRTERARDCLVRDVGRTSLVPAPAGACGLATRPGSHRAELCTPGLTAT